MGDPAPPASARSGGLGVSVNLRMLVAAGVGVIAGAAVSVGQTWRYGLLLGWVAAAAVFVGWTWLLIAPMDAPSTARHALREDPKRHLTTDLAVLGAALASLLAVGSLLTGGASGGSSKDVQAALSLTSIALAWTAVHTIFTTRYARLYYSGSDGGIDFNSDEKPCYSDFAYVAFTVGMAYAVSDTALQTRAIRATALGHALLSFVFGTGIIAATINLVAGLTR